MTLAAVKRLMRRMTALDFSSISILDSMPLTLADSDRSTGRSQAQETLLLSLEA